jgi:hypothetical protein
MDQITQTFSNININAHNLDDKIQQIQQTQQKYSNILYYELKFSQKNYDQIFHTVINSSESLSVLDFAKLNEEQTEKFTKIINKTKSAKSASPAKSANPANIMVVVDNNVYDVKDEFHITVLYTGGAKDPRADTLTQFLGQKYFVSIDKIGINKHFISLSISILGNLPYYGNNTKHITFGLNNYDPNKKALPKDSFTALLSDKHDYHIITLGSPLVVEAEFNIKTR